MHIETSGRASATLTGLLGSGSRSELLKNDLSLCGSQGRRYLLVDQN